MKDASVVKFKNFGAHQDREQEQWLRAMANQGLHLKSFNMFGFYTFIKGEPEDVVYRSDFVTKMNTGDYRRLFEDAGWECAGETSGLYLWRKRVLDGREPQIFTDAESSVARFQRLLMIVALTSVTFVILALISDPVPTHLKIMIAVFGPYNCYAVYAMRKRIREIRAER